jgi:hypothetical protein
MTANGDENYCPELWQRVFIAQFNDKFKLKPCCVIATTNTTQVELTGAPQLFDRYNHSASIVNLREQNLNGKLDPGCNTCVYSEATSGTSPRLDAINRMSPDEPLVLLSHVDLNLGSLCNLSCAICGPHSSTSWNPLWKTMYGNFPRDASYDKNNRPVIDDPEWFKNIKVLQLQGGEVFLQPDYIKFFNNLKKYKNLNSVDVKIFTNGTVLPDPELFSLLNECQSVYLWVSIDDIGNRFEYQRRGANWTNILENLNWYNTHCNNTFRLGINVTQSLLNVFYLNETYNFFEQHYPGFILNNNRYNSDTGVLSIYYLPAEIKTAIINKNNSNKNLNELENTITIDNSYKFDAAIEYIQQYDVATNTLYADAHPEFWKLITDYTERNT